MKIMVKSLKKNLVNEELDFGSVHSFTLYSLWVSPSKVGESNMERRINLPANHNKWRHLGKKKEKEKENNNRRLQPIKNL